MNGILQLACLKKNVMFKRVKSDSARGENLKVCLKFIFLLMAKYHIRYF